MVSAAGILLSTALGASVRRLQIAIIHKKLPGNQWAGYLLSIGAFVGAYTILDGYVDGNRSLLKRRLAQLREQRAQTDAFFEFDLEEDDRLTAPKRSGKFFRLLDTYGKDYK